MRMALIVMALSCLATLAHAASFSHTDRNRDGVVSFDEAEETFPRLNFVLIKKADRNGNGVIDKTEMPALNSINRFQNER